MYSDFRNTLISPDPKIRGMRGPAVVVEQGDALTDLASWGGFL